MFTNWTPQSKRQYMKRKYTDFTVKKMFWELRSVKKIMLIVIWDMKGHIMIFFKKR